MTSTLKPLSREDDKRVIMEDGVNTYARGHFRTLEGGDSVSWGTN